MRIKNRLRIIFAIARKDLVDAIRNKLLLSIMLSVAFLMLSSQAISWISRVDRRPTVYLYDLGSSSILKAWSRSDTIRLVQLESVESLKQVVGDSPKASIGLVLPENLDSLAVGEGRVILEGYYPAAQDLEAVQSTGGQVQAELGQLLNPGVELEISGSPVFPAVNSFGYPMMIGFGLVMGVMSIGLILTPYLIIDEKTTRTMESLLWSPAKPADLIAGKLVTGMIYSLTASGFILAFSHTWFQNWWLVGLAVFLGALAANLLGLLTGILVNSPNNVNMMAGLILGVTILPMYFWPRLSTELSAAVLRVANLVPSISVYKLVRISFLQSFSPWLFLEPFYALLVVIVLLSLLVIHQVGRMIPVK
jgi:ABC-type Na+ efflux pump permease subunit